MGSDSQQAEAALRRAIDLNPDFLLALRTYAQIRREQELRTAIDGMSRYVERYPQKRSERLLLASLRRGVGGSEVEISAEEFRRLLEERPDDSMAALGLAVAFLELDKWRDAKAIYEKLLLTNPSDPSPEFNLAIVAWDYEHDLPRAAEHFQRYLDKGTDEPFLLQSRARMFLQEIQEKLPPRARRAAPRASRDRGSPARVRGVGRGGGAVVGKIGRGIVVLAAVLAGDRREDAIDLAEKIADYRIFEDDGGKTNLSVAEVGGQYCW